MKRKHSEDVEHPIYRHLTKNGHVLTEEGVCIGIHDLDEGDYELSVCFEVYHSVEIEYSYGQLVKDCVDGVQEFATLFGISKPEEMLKITGHQLWRMFLAGNVSLSMMIEDLIYEFSILKQPGGDVVVYKWSEMEGHGRRIPAFQLKTIPDFWQCAAEYHLELKAKGILKSPSISEFSMSPVNQTT